MIIEIGVEHVSHKLALYRGFVPNRLEVVCRTKPLVPKLQRVKPLKRCTQVYFTKVQASSDFTRNGDSNDAIQPRCPFGNPSENRLPAVASGNGKLQIVDLSCGHLVAASINGAVGGDRRHNCAPPSIFTELEWVWIARICVALGVLRAVIVAKECMAQSRCFNLLCVKGCVWFLPFTLFAEP